MVFFSFLRASLNIVLLRTATRPFSSLVEILIDVRSSLSPHMKNVIYSFVCPHGRRVTSFFPDRPPAPQQALFQVIITEYPFFWPPSKSSELPFEGETTDAP